MVHCPFSPQFNNLRFLGVVADMVSFLTHLAASLAMLALTLTYQRIHSFLKRRNLGAILGFAVKDVVFVYPPRIDEFTKPSGLILPRTSTEDFLAINNLISAMLKVGWTGDISLKRSDEFHERDYHHNLILVCSPALNKATELVLRELAKRYTSLPTFETEPDSQRMYIQARHDYFSTTYDVVESCVQKGVRPSEAEMTDHALVVKAPNPWDPEKTVFIVAGIRGIGTWGAAECLKKEWQQIFNAKRGDGDHKKSGPFAAIIEIHFDRCDLIAPKLETMIDLD